MAHRSRLAPAGGRHFACNARGSPSLRGTRGRSCCSSLSTGERSRNMNETTSYLPHHRLVAYSVARELVLAVVAARIRDAKLRDQALRAAKSAALNTAEGAGRVSPADKARVFAIARGEAGEAAAGVEIAALCGDTSAASAAKVHRLASRLTAMLAPLARRR